ncbi:MAG TPA: Rpn family recombination-promoting nuclease/putative transposase [Alphaproteobacteria bacterium]|nr:Rpn family recombination-promoting nuclease/putative transposase [Alphaproteobacteria bacterium]HQS94738.1 Rpn family recombination-promoting nuclease/putative transposase [Alphaproteobacteria bacterium]
MEKITPRVDIAFKKIFGVEENKDLLISLINSIIGEEDKVSEVTLLNPYNPKNFKKDKLSILDIKAKGEDGKRFNIEIQISDEADYDKRALYYWAKLYTEQLKVSEDYSKLSKAIGIHILNFTSIPSVKKYHNVFHVREKESGLLYFKDLELHTIELKKFSENSQEELSDIVAKVKNALDIWMAFLTRHDLLNKDHLPPALDNEDLKKALTVLDVMNFDEEEREIYEGHLKWLRVEANTLKKYEAKGFEEGKEKGREEGKEEGKEEEKEEIALKMIKKKMDIEAVIEITGLTREKIEQLMKEEETLEDA